MQKEKQLQALEKHIQEGIFLIERIENCYPSKLYRNQTWSEHQHFPAAKTAAILVSKFLKDIFKDSRIKMPVIPCPEEEILDEIWDMKYLLEQVAETIIPHTSWKLECFPIMEMLSQSKEYANKKSKDREIWMDNICKKFRSLFTGIIARKMSFFRPELQTLVYRMEGNEINTEEIYVYYNNRIPRFLKTLEELTRESLLEEEYEEKNSVAAYIHRKTPDYPFFYAVYDGQFPQGIMEEELVYTSLHCTYTDGWGMDVDGYMLKPEQFLSMYIMDRIMDYMELKYPDWFKGCNKAERLVRGGRQ